MTSRRFASAVYGDAAPGGRFAVMIHNAHVETDAGPVAAPENLLYLRATWQGGRRWLAGCGHQSDMAWLHDGAGWVPTGGCAGVNPVAFGPGVVYVCRGRDSTEQIGLDGSGAIRFPLATGAMGIRWVSPLGPVTADSSYADPARGLFQYTDYGDVAFGEGDDAAGGGVVARFADDGVLRRMEPGVVRWVRVQRDGDQIGLAYARQDTRECVVLWTTLAEVRAWPAVPPVPVEPVDIAPFAAHFYAACYKDASLKAPANIIFAAEPLNAPITGPAIVGTFRKTLDFAVGWILGIEDVEATRIAALACKLVKPLPVYAYIGGYVPEATIDGVDYPVLQAYRVPGYETSTAILAQLRADVARCAYARVGLAVDLTDRTLPGVGGWPERDRVAFLAGIADLCREIQPAAVFGWAWDRRAPQAGISSSAVITEQWRRFVAAIPPLPDPPDPPDPPEPPMPDPTKLVSPNGQYEVNIQDDGNLVVYARGGRPVWASGADPHPGPDPDPDPLPDSPA
jgi:hypothetical protein